MSRHHDPGAWPVLDVGGEVGALVVHLAAVPAGGELQAQPAGGPAGRFHTGVHLRQVGGDAVPVALYPALVEGGYDILGDDLLPLATVQVVGGEVAQLDLRALSMIE
ncbi:MAG: phospholipase [Acidimicrobiales bacterium]